MQSIHIEWQGEDPSPDFSDFRLWKAPASGGAVDAGPGTTAAAGVAAGTMPTVR